MVYSPRTNVGQVTKEFTDEIVMNRKLEIINNH